MHSHRSAVIERGCSIGANHAQKMPADGFGPEDTRDTTAFSVIMAVTFGLIVLRMPFECASPASA
jgi:hypothetical protein